MPFGFRDGGWITANPVAEGARPRGGWTHRADRRRRGRLGGGSTRRRWLSRRQLWPLWILPRRRSRELHEPSLHGRAGGWRLRRGNDRQGQRPDKCAGRSLIG